MPTYEYVCDACEHELEEFQSMTAKPLRKCPACGKNKLRRLIGTGAGIIFKGSGFYETDYRSESYKSAAKKEKESANSKPESSEAKSRSDKSTARNSSASQSDSKPKAEKKPGKSDSKKPD